MEATMTLHRLLLALGLLFGAGVLGVSAQKYKVIEKSDKKAPAWYESAGAGYIVASAEAENMEEARRLCMESVQRQMVQAIAQNIEFADSHSVTQVAGNGGRMTEFVDRYTAQGSTKAASLPFIKGISPSKVEGSYWEKRQDKKSGRITCCYALRYPFPESEHKALIAAFERYDSGMEQTVRELEGHLPEVASIDEMEQCMDKLKTVADYFFDRGRREWAESVLRDYRRLSASVTAESRPDGKDACLVSLFLQGRKITTSAMPRLTANCASQLKAMPCGDDIRVTYNSEDCLDDEENFVEMVFKMPGKSLRHKFYFKAE